MTEHTPTPWRVGANSFGTQFIYGNPDQPRTSPMGVVYNDLVAGGDDPGRLTEANAAFVVKVVNNHDALVNALRNARNYIDAVVINTPDKKKRRNYAECLRIIEDALKPVGGNEFAKDRSGAPVGTSGSRS